MRLVSDIEANDLYYKGNTIHCIGIIDLDTKEEFLYTENNILEGLDKLQQAEYVVFHNGINYDRPFIQKIHPWFNCTVKDTMLISRLVWTNLQELDITANNKLKGSHSLEAWGHRLKVNKGNYGKYNSWDKYTYAMGQYCLQDCRVTMKLWELIEKQNYSSESIVLEHMFAEIITLQEHSGFYFNTEKAIILLDKLKTRQQELTEELSEYVQDTRIEMKTPQYWDCEKNGIKMQFPTKGAAQQYNCDKIERGPNKVKVIPFNPNSRDQIAKLLRDKHGWEPQVFTDTGKAKIDEDVLSKLEYPEAKIISESMMITKRIGQLSEGDNAWLKYTTNNRIHGSIITNGAVTGRCAHFAPNIGQVPATYSPYGKECRELFVVPPGYVLVGCDASGLEARCLAHFMYYWDNGEFIKTILEGDKDKGTDIHSLNATLLGLSRDDAKTFFYGFLYGAGNEKLGKIANKDGTYGEEMKKKLFDGLPALKALVDAVHGQVEANGYLKGLDGRLLHIRSIHSSLNTLLQSAGALVMKKSLCYFNEYLSNNFVYNRDYFYCANVHDEFQVAVRNNKSLPDDIGNAACVSIERAGEYFKFNCKLDGEYKIGQNWMETH